MLDIKTLWLLWTRSSHAQLVCLYKIFWVIFSTTAQSDHYTVTCLKLGDLNVISKWRYRLCKGIPLDWIELYTWGVNAFHTICRYDTIIITKAFPYSYELIFLWRMKMVQGHFISLIFGTLKTWHKQEWQIIEKWLSSFCGFFVFSMCSHNLLLSELSYLLIGFGLIWGTRRESKKLSKREENQKKTNEIIIIMKNGIRKLINQIDFAIV